jgi:hypothetical protein
MKNSKAREDEAAYRAHSMLRRDTIPPFHLQRWRV